MNSCKKLRDQKQAFHNLCQKQLPRMSFSLYKEPKRKAYKTKILAASKDSPRTLIKSRNAQFMPRSTVNEEVARTLSACIETRVP